VELPPHQTWHIILTTSDAKVVSARVAGIKEE
jgi:hypothetical protein